MGINVLSLFDGMACGLVALKRAGIQVDNYYASEIDKYAMLVAKKNHPEIQHIGDVTKIDLNSLPKIDLLIGGSPCQGFSIAGQGLNFDDPRSKLFFTYVQIRDELHRKNPELQFLLENVKMKQAWQDIINDEMGVFPVEINSALVSAQNRKRLYWANWKIEQPEDLGLILADVLEDEVEEKYLGGYNPSYKTQSNSLHDVDGKSNVLCANTHGYANGYIEVKGAALRNQVTKRGVEAQLNVRKDDKSNCVVPTTYTEKLNGMVFVGGLEKGRRLDDGKNLSRNFRDGSRIYSPTGKAATLTAQPKGGEGGYTGLYLVGTATDIKGTESMLRVYSKEGKAPTIAAHSGGNLEPKVAMDELHYRKLTVVECERLQTLPECDIIQSLWLHIMKLSNQSKTCVPAEISNGRLIRPVGNAEKDKSSTHVKPVTEIFIIKHPLSEFTAQMSVDMQIEIRTSKHTNPNSAELMWSVDNAENLLQFQNQGSKERREELSALLSASINSTQVKIVVNGLEVLHLRDKHLYPLQNGETLLNRYGQEIKNPVSDVVYINPNLNMPTTFTTLSPLLVAQRIEQIQTILFFYAQNAIDGYTLKQILIDGCWICPITNKPIEIQGYTEGVSNTQRYKMCGNGWTIDVISHILKSNPNLR